MASPYQAYGTRPGNAYPNESSLGGPQAYSRDDHSIDSDAEEMYKHPNLNNSKDVHLEMRTVTRTPSPTPSEQTELSKKHLWDFKEMSRLGYWFRREWLWYYVAIILGTVIFALFTIFHKQIVNWLQPAANWMHNLPAGWLIPIAILFVISFPPLFGHEIIAILCGVVWGLWAGFAIVAAGTFIGEVGNFYAFRYCCAARGEKLEKSKLQYACLAHVVRQGGFKIALIARFSAIPGHFTTAVFSTCGMNIWVFMLAAFLSLPKQFITVYLGVALESSENGQTSTKDNIIKYVVLFVTAAITFVAMWYIYHLMNKVKPQVIYERRKARQGQLSSNSGMSVPYGNSSVLQSTASVSYNPNVSEAELPLTANFNGGPGYQQWDQSGHAVGYAPDPLLYAPQPQRPVQRLPLGSQPGSATPSKAPTPATSDGRRQPSRQDTASSWDARGHVGGSEAIRMTTSPPRHDAYASPVPARLPPPPQPAQPQTAAAAYMQPPPPVHSAGSSPSPSYSPSPVSAPPNMGAGYSASPEPTPTQAQPQYAYAPPRGPPPASGMQTPPSAPLPNPFGDPAPLPPHHGGAEDPYAGYSSPRQ